MDSHELIIDAVQPDLVWVTGKNVDILKDMWEPRALEWRGAGKHGLEFGSGTIKISDKWMDFAFTPTLSSWDASNDQSQEMLRWRFQAELSLGCCEEGWGITSVS